MNQSTPKSKQIKSKKVIIKITIDKLAQMVANGFSEFGGRINELNESLGGRIDALSERMDDRFAQVDKRFAQVNMRFEEIDIELRYIKTDLKYVKEDVSEIKRSIIPPLEFEDLMARVKYAEEKIGIESGK